MSTIDAILKAIEIALALPKVAREQPMNLAHLKLLIVIYQNPNIRTDDLLGYFANEKPTLISRINFLENKKLLIKLPRYNAGGNTHPNYYRLTRAGNKMISLLDEEADGTTTRAGRK